MKLPEIPTINPKNLLEPLTKLLGGIHINIVVNQKEEPKKEENKVNNEIINLLRPKKKSVFEPDKETNAERFIK